MGYGKMDLMNGELQIAGQLRAIAAQLRAVSLCKENVRSPYSLARAIL